MRDLLLAGATLAFLALAISLHQPADCRTEVASRAVAPNGQWQAIAFRHACENAPQGSEVVAIFPMGNATEGAGNVFVSAAQSQTRSGIDLHWLTPARLEVTYDGHAHVFQRLPNMGHIRIQYVFQPSP